MRGPESLCAAVRHSLRYGKRQGWKQPRPQDVRCSPREVAAVRWKETSMKLDVLPLAFTMLAGPQIMSAIIFVTAPKALKLSAYFLAGVVIAVTAGVTITYTLATVLGNIIQYVLVGLLVSLSIRSYVNRETSEPPRWLGAMQNAKPKTAFLAGLLLLSVFPSDLVILVTVGLN